MHKKDKSHEFFNAITRFFILYKNTLYKNVHDENGQKIKDIVRILPS